jgi:hypothetical protein
MVLRSKSHRCIGSLEPAVALRAVAGAAIATSMAASGTAPGVDAWLQQHLCRDERGEDAPRFHVHVHAGLHQDAPELVRDGVVAVRERHSW